MKKLWILSLLVCVLSSEVVTIDLIMNNHVFQVQREVVGRKECVDSQRAGIGDIITVRFQG